MDTVNLIITVYFEDVIPQTYSVWISGMMTLTFINTSTASSTFTSSSTNSCFNALHFECFNDFSAKYKYKFHISSVDASQDLQTIN